MGEVSEQSLALLEPQDAPTVATGFIESFQQRYPAYIFELLLKDQTTGKNIIWADDEYEALGEGYGRDEEITSEAISGTNSGVIKPRIAKDRESQSARIKNHAEVFTPSWLCNQMNNYLDEEWFGRSDVFNTEGDQTWDANDDNIKFQNKAGYRWRDYIVTNRLEITCGEAPFICSRYDTVTGQEISVAQRVGFLDRKLRVVSKKSRKRDEWVEQALQALKSTYGYEYQGDNLLVARVNILETFVEHASTRWKTPLSRHEITRAAHIISWNLWQMDGLTYAVPSGNPVDKLQASLFEEEQVTSDAAQPTLFGGSKSESVNDEPEIGAPLCKIFNWEENKAQRFIDLKNGELSEMKKFYAVIGNPPYQEDTEGTSDKPIYNFFMDESYKISERTELITPARFLFNAGKTPKKWNQQMLQDPHLKVLFFEQNSNEIFPNTGITGGIAVTYRDEKSDFGAIKVFSPFKELQSLQRKITPSLDQSKGGGRITELMHLQNKFNLEELYKDFPEIKELRSSEGQERRIVTSSFNELPCFVDERRDDHDVCILGLSKGNKRTFKWINKKYVEDNGVLYKFKVILPMANGSGAIGEVQSTPLIGEPLIGEPLIGYTQSFLAIGACDERPEAESILKYVKSKFARALLGILKVTQHNTPEKWNYVPIQDFTSNSDIDWTQSVADIDQQLYKKYGLNKEEIEFIETHVQAMD